MGNNHCPKRRLKIFRSREEGKSEAMRRRDEKPRRPQRGGNRPCDIAVAGRAIPLRVTLTNSTAICVCHTTMISTTVQYRSLNA